MRLQKQFAEVAKAKLDAPTLRKGMLEAHRFGSDEALSCGFVDAVVPVEQLATGAHALAVSKMADTLKLFNFSAESFSAMKTEMWTDAYRALVREGDADPDARL
jgi:enoyl-CoA hydratase/carnithine racemase